MRIRLPGIYYVLRNKLNMFIERNWRGCTYCNDKESINLFPVDVGSAFKPIGTKFNTLLDSVPLNGNTSNIACYFNPRMKCIEINIVNENMKTMPIESIIVNNCPCCGRRLSPMRFPNSVRCLKD